MLNKENLKIEEKIGQMLIISLQEEQITQETIDMIEKYKIGGIILYRKNYNSYEEMLELVNKLKKINRKNGIPLFISIDQEGGRVNRMPCEITKIESASKLASTRDIDIVRESANITSKMLKSMGINMNYSPVLDIKRFDEQHAIGDRCYGENKEDVSKYGIEFMKETMQQGVIPVVKHFPGHGATVQDSHMSLPVVKIDKEKLENSDMIPFGRAIENGAEAVMVGHILIKDIDKKYPASLSKKIIQKYLIEEYKFKGLIITDDLKMSAIRLRYTPSNAVKLAINAGNNVIMIGLKYKTIQKVIKNIARKVRKGRIDILKIDESVDKIISIKEKYNINDDNVEGFNIDEINKQIEELNSKI